jgi:segregation and condensation protein A
MEERSVPWWRKALHFALDGIRSGFGLFSRTPIKNETLEPVRPAGQQENLKEESELIDHSPTLNPEEETRAADEAPTSAALAAPLAQAPTQVEPDREPVPEPAPEAQSTEIETGADVEAGDPEAATANIYTDPPEPEQIKTIEEPHATAVQSHEEPASAIHPPPEPTPEPIEEIVADLQPESAEPPAPEVMSAQPSAKLQPESESQSQTTVLPAVESESATPESPLPVSAFASPALESETEPIQPSAESAEIETAQETPDESLPDPIAQAAPQETTEPPPIHIPVSGLAASPVESNESVAIEPPKDPVEQTALVEEDADEDVEEESLNETVLPAEAVLTTEAERPAPEQESEQEPPQAQPTMELNDPIPEQPADQPTESGAVRAADEVEEPTVPSSQSPAEAAAELAIDPEPEAAIAQANPSVQKPLIKLESRDNQADLSPFSVIVAQVYDGPLDLLLDLIRKQDIDIYDIPIARITAQFLAYVNQLKATDVDVAGEFIYTASLLIHIKSKMLLPRAPSGPDDAAEDPRRELVERLLEHERFKNAAQMLQQKQMLEAASWSNPGIHEFRDDVSAEPEIAADTVDLVRIFRDILERARNRPVINVAEDSVTVGQMIQFLTRRLTMEDKPVALRRLLSHTRSERALIAMFLALLELVRMQAILLRQDRAFSEIFIKKHSGFENLMNEGLANARDDWQ